MPFTVTGSTTKTAVAAGMGSAVGERSGMNVVVITGVVVVRRVAEGLMVAAGESVTIGGVVTVAGAVILGLGLPGEEVSIGADGGWTVGEDGGPESVGASMVFRAGSLSSRAVGGSWLVDCTVSGTPSILV